MLVFHRASLRTEFTYQAIPLTEHLPIAFSTDVIVLAGHGHEIRPRNVQSVGLMRKAFELREVGGNAASEVIMDVVEDVMIRLSGFAKPGVTKARYGCAHERGNENRLTTIRLHEVDRCGFAAAVVRSDWAQADIIAWKMLHVVLFVEITTAHIDFRSSEYRALSAVVLEVAPSYLGILDVFSELWPIFGGQVGKSASKQVFHVVSAPSS